MKRHRSVEPGLMYVRNFLAPQPLVPPTLVLRISFLQVHLVALDSILVRM
jgi:hypothetical protein